MKNILIIGATSAIAEATARIFARRGDRLYLLARNPERLAALSRDLQVRGAASVEHGRIDVGSFEEHEGLLNTAFEALGKVDVVLLAHGTLPDQEACERDFATCLQALNTNAVGTISILTHVANRMETQGSGTIAVITSVAGDRGRQSNYVYGAAKGMLSIFLQGLRNRLYGSGVNVLDIKPGFVDTPMTAAFRKGPLWVQPDRVAAGIAKGIDAGRHEIYTPFYWRVIMLVIRNIPEVIFKRLKL